MTEANLTAAVASVRQQIGKKEPLLGVVLGSGLGHLVERLTEVTSVPYEAIAGMPRVGVPGHAGRLWLGQLDEVPVACLAGRSHLYEGHAPARVAFGVRLLAALGCRGVLLTNAAGATTSRLSPGSLMLITDHINLTGQNPLIGQHHPARFLDMMGAYDPEFGTLAKETAASLGMVLEEGVYAGMLGPSYETPAEVRMLAALGADAVGMSTVLETLALRDAGVRVMGLSCITNAAAGVAGACLDHEHVQAVANAARERLEALVRGWVLRVAQRL